MLFLVIFQLHRRKVRAAISVKFIVTRILIIFSPLKYAAISLLGHIEY